MLDNLSKRSPTIKCKHLIAFLLLRGVEPMGLLCPHSDLHQFITPMPGELPCQNSNLEELINNQSCDHYITGEYNKYSI